MDTRLHEGLSVVVCPAKDPGARQEDLPPLPSPNEDGLDLDQILSRTAAKNKREADAVKAAERAHHKAHRSSKHGRHSRPPVPTLGNELKATLAQNREAREKAFIQKMFGVIPSPAIMPWETYTPDIINYGIDPDAAAPMTAVGPDFFQRYGGKGSHACGTNWKTESNARITAATRGDDFFRINQEGVPDDLAT